MASSLCNWRRDGDLCSICRALCVVANALLDFQCVSSALPVRYSVRYPVRYLPLLLESQYKVSDAHCVLRRSKIDKSKIL